MAKNLSTKSGYPICMVPIVRGKDIERIMRRLGISQIKLAHHLGVAARTIRQWRDNPEKVISDPSRCRDLQDMLEFRINGRSAFD